MKDDRIEKFEEMASKSKLTQEEIKDFLEKSRSIDIKVRHKQDYATMMNQVRREIVDFIGYEIKSINEMEERFQIKEDLLQYHLSMLKQSLYIIESSEGWKNSPKGLGYLENAVTN